MSNVYVLGIDPAKKNLAAALFAPGEKKPRFEAAFDQSREGFDALANLLLASVPKEAILLAGVEATCALGKNILHFLSHTAAPFSITVYHLDPAQVKHHSGARPVRGKTDRADARRIADFLRVHHEQLHPYTPDPEAQMYERLLSERAWLKRDLTAKSNRLQDRLVLSFPEAAKVLSDMDSPLALHVFQKAPTAAHCARRLEKTLAAIQPGKGKHYLGAKRAKQLLTLSKTSIASATTEHDAATIINLAGEMIAIINRIEEIDGAIEEYAGKTTEEEKPATTAAGPLSLPEQIRLVNSIPGYGTHSAALLVIKTGGLHRYQSPGALKAQLGVTPDRLQTGTSKDSGRLTHRGDRRTRTGLFQTALVGTTYDLAFAFHSWRLRQSDRGKNATGEDLKPLVKKQALCANLGRQLTIAWKLIQDRKPYSPQKAIRIAITQHPRLWMKYLEQHRKPVEKHLEKIGVDAKGALI